MGRASKKHLAPFFLKRASAMSVQVLRACVELSKEEFVVSFCEVRQRIEIAFISVSNKETELFHIITMISGVQRHKDLPSRGFTF